MAITGIPRLRELWLWGQAGFVTQGRAHRAGHPREGRSRCRKVRLGGCSRPGISRAFGKPTSQGLPKYPQRWGNTAEERLILPACLPAAPPAAPAFPSALAFPFSRLDLPSLHQPGGINPNTTHRHSKASLPGSPAFPSAAPSLFALELVRILLWSLEHTHHQSQPTRPRSGSPSEPWAAKETLGPLQH